MSSSIRLILVMLRVAAVDGPKMYGSIDNAIEDIERTLVLHRGNLDLQTVDSILRENGIDVDVIEEAYVGRD